MERAVVVKGRMVGPTTVELSFCEMCTPPSNSQRSASPTGYDA
jgi:hypothetical protein